jgi:hypothetical protein
LFESVTDSRFIAGALQVTGASAILPGAGL